MKKIILLVTIFFSATAHAGKSDKIPHKTPDKKSLPREKEFTHKKSSKKINPASPNTQVTPEHVNSTFLLLVMAASLCDNHTHPTL